MNPHRVIIVGGGAAGIFAAAVCAEANPECTVTVFEKGSQPLSKVLVSGGGRCNVTHACFDPIELSNRYPRGKNALRSAFHRFQPQDTIAWFERHGVRLKTESDGRMFPDTDLSQTIADCLMQAARKAGVNIITQCGIKKVDRIAQGGFRVVTSNGETRDCDRLLLATGGCRESSMGDLPVSLGHALEKPVPSIFTFNIEAPWLRELAGVALDKVEVSIPALRLRETGAVMITHWGLSGPVVLKLSAWGARSMHDCNYSFTLHLDWLPDLNDEQTTAEFESRRHAQGAKQVVNTPIAPLTARLWRQLLLATGIREETRWAGLTKELQLRLCQCLHRTELKVSGKSTNKEEFVTCGGVRLNEVNFKTMESRICPGLYVAGELLDVDGVTGGFNFQAAWTTGWIAGNAMAVG